MLDLAPLRAEALLTSSKASLEAAQGDNSAQQGASIVRQLHAYVFLECLQQPQLRSEAGSALMQAISGGRLGCIEVGLSLIKSPFTQMCS